MDSPKYAAIKKSAYKNGQDLAIGALQQNRYNCENSANVSFCQTTLISKKTPNMSKEDVSAKEDHNHAKPVISKDEEIR